MKIRAKISLRNEAAIAAREKLGLTQAEAARRIGVPQGSLCDLECLRFDRFGVGGYRSKGIGDRQLMAIAFFYGVSDEELLPADLRGKSFTNHAEAVKDVPTTALLGMAADAPSAEQKLIGEEVKAAIGEALDDLTFREREIVKLRYGMGGEGEYTLEEVSRIFRITRERVRQIEMKAMRKLRHPKRSRRILLATEGADE